jgi:hypothetical protein
LIKKSFPPSLFSCILNILTLLQDHITFLEQNLPINTFSLQLISFFALIATQNHFFNTSFSISFHFWPSNSISISPPITAHRLYTIPHTQIASTKSARHSATGQLFSATHGTLPARVDY